MELDEPPLLINLIGNSTELNVPLKREPPGMVSASAQITQLQCPHTGSRRPARSQTLAAPASSIGAVTR